MKKTATLGALLLALALPLAAQAETVFAGEVTAETAQVIAAPYGGLVEDVRVRVGDSVKIGDPIATVETRKTYASMDGTVSGVFAREGDSADGVKTQYGALVYIEPINRYTLECSTEKGYNSSENRYIHIGESVFLKCTKDGSHQGRGVVTGLDEKDDNKFTVEVTGGEFYMGETVDIYRSGDYASASRIGRGTVGRTKTVAVNAEGSVLKMHVKAGDTVERGELLFGTVETWLIWKLTGGKVHVTDYSNASRTMLFNINTLQWDDDILKELDIPRCMLPTPMPSSCIYGETDPSLLGGPIKIAGAAGDQQSALFGQACYHPGEAKNTYGTGCFLLMHTGHEACASEHGLVTTVAASAPNAGDTEYALEGSVFMAGALIQWLRDELGIIDSVAETDAIARSVATTDGVFVVPAFTGLGAPWWDADARGAILGLTRGAGRAHIVRAALESIAYQVCDLARAMAEDARMPLSVLNVDGGAAANDFLMQFQADMLGAPLRRPDNAETTALGAAYLAGLSTGFWKSTEELAALREGEDRFLPTFDEPMRAARLAAWHEAVSRVRS